MNGKKFTRSATDKWLGGVCGGLAEYTGWDVNIIRLLTVLVTLVSTGTGLIAYLAAWVIVPEDRGI